MPIAALEEIDSTNAEAFRRASAGETGPLWITARRQTAGRGRGGRSWVSPEGNLHASLLLTLACGAREAVGLSLVAGVAVHDALTELARERALEVPFRLKWPNDVLVDGAKLCGVLIETATRTGGAIDAVIGVGLNIASHPEGLGRAVTSLAAAGLVTSPESAVAALAASFHDRIDQWREGAGFPAVREAWLARSIPVGTPIGVNTVGGRQSGAFGGVDGEGMLILRGPGGGSARITFGDVLIGG